MKKLFATLLLAAMAAPASFAVHGDHKGVEHAVENFYAALNQLLTGEMAAMKKVWSHADDITYLGPSGDIKTGWLAVLKDWEAQAALKLGGKIEAKDIHITINGNLAVVVNYEEGKIKGPDGSMNAIKIRATSSFRRENGTWKMIGHHVDPMSLQ